MVTVGSDNPFPSVLFREHIDPANPAAGDQRLFVDTDHLLKMVDSSGTVTTFATGAAGLSDPMTTRGDIIIRNSSNVTARLAIGSSGKVLSSDGTDISWQTPAAVFPTYVQALMSTNTSMVSNNTWTDLTSATVSLVAGTWLVVGKAQVLCANTALTNVGLRVTDGTNHYASGEVGLNANSGAMNGNHNATITTPWCVVTLGGTTSVKLQGITNTGTTNTVFETAIVNNATGNNATGILAVRVA